jgi:hypothetical protein
VHIDGKFIDLSGSLKVGQRQGKTIWTASYKHRGVDFH